MFDIMKAVRETAAARSAVTRARRPRPELIRLRVEIERTKCAIEPPGTTLSRPWTLP